jgi:hypothetical protein
MNFTDVGRVLLLVGSLLAGLGLLLLLAGRFPLMGRLPGDITIRRGNVSCYVPIVTSIVLSVLLTVLLNLVVRLLGR